MLLPKWFASRAALFSIATPLRRAPALPVVPLSLTLRSRGSSPVMLWPAFLIVGWRLKSSGRAESEAEVPFRRVVPEAEGHAAEEGLAVPRPAATDPTLARRAPWDRFVHRPYRSHTNPNTTQRRYQSCRTTHNHSPKNFPLVSCRVNCPQHRTDGTRASD